MRKIDLSRRGYLFFSNVERGDASRYAVALEESLERSVVAWLYDTGLWGAKFLIQISPVVKSDAIVGMTVLAVVDVEGHPYLVTTQAAAPAEVATS